MPKAQEKKSLTNMTINHKFGEKIWQIQKQLTMHK